MTTKITKILIAIAAKNRLPASCANSERDRGIEDCWRFISDAGP